MQKTLLSWAFALTFLGLMVGCETEQLESDTVRTPMNVPEESEYTGSPAEAAKQQAEEKTESEPTTTSDATEPASEPLTYWDKKPAATDNNASNSTNGGNFESSVQVAEAPAEAPAEESALDQALALKDPAEGAPSSGIVETEQVGTTLTEADNEGSSAVETNTKLVIQLPGNPTTGYTWSVDSYDTSVLSLEGHDYAPGSNDRVGSGGVFSFQFKAIAQGSTTVKLAYARPWEKDVPPAKTFTNEVDVQ